MAQSDLSDSNFVPVTLQKAYNKRRPANVPKLDLQAIPHYDSDSSSDSDAEDEEGKAKRGPNPGQLKKILDRYNIMTCARNLMEQEKKLRKKRQGSESSILIERTSDFFNEYSGS